VGIERISDDVVILGKAVAAVASVTAVIAEAVVMAEVGTVGSGTSRQRISRSAMVHCTGECK